MMGHIEVMARDIALIEVLGPHPEASVRFMESLIDKARAEGALPSPILAGSFSVVRNY